MTKLALLSDPEVRVARLPGEIAVISLLGEHDVTRPGRFETRSPSRSIRAPTLSLT